MRVSAPPPYPSQLGRNHYTVLRSLKQVLNLYDTLASRHCELALKTAVHTQLLFLVFCGARGYIHVPYTKCT